MRRDDPHVHLELGSRLENIDLAQMVVEECLRRLELEEDTSHWVGIAVREAVANAIKHGNQEDPDKQVEVDFGVDGDELVIQVTDHGTGFELSQVDDPLAPENLLRPNGRGIFFMKSFMDAIDYNFDPEAGTRVTLRKRLTVPASGSADQEEER